MFASHWLRRPLPSSILPPIRFSALIRSQPSRSFRHTVRNGRLRFEQSSAQNQQNLFQRQSQYQEYGYRRPRNIFQRWAARPSFYIEVGGLGALGGCLYIYNLEQVPVSGRLRFNVVSAETEKQTSVQMYQQVLKEYGPKILSEWDQRTVMVRRVLDRLIPASGLSDSDWEVYVIDEPKERNAFVIPGGKVFVFTGILPICANDDGLAAVLGHEIAHNVAHHAAERMSQAMILLAGIWLLRIASLALTGYISSEADWASQWVLDLTFTKPGSRKQESEADYIGLLMAAQSCYDPREAVNVWARMAKAGQHAPPQFLSTHPSDETRMKTIESWLPQAYEKQQASNCGFTVDKVQRFKEVFKQNLP